LVTRTLDESPHQTSSRRSLTYVNSDVLSENAIGAENVPLPGDWVTRVFNFGNPPKKAACIALFQNENAARIFLSKTPLPPGKCHLINITSFATIKEFLAGQLASGVERVCIDPLETDKCRGLSIHEILLGIGE
jgi:hypothetical protein